MAGIALLEIRLWSRFAVFIKLSVAPAASGRVLLRILHHELQIPRRSFAGHERLFAAKDLVVFLRRHVTPGDSRDDRAVRERLLPFPISIDREIVAENRADIVEI